MYQLTTFHKAVKFFTHAVPLIVSAVILIIALLLLVTYIKDNYQCINCFLGASIAFWIQTSVIALSALFAFLAFRANGVISRQRATIDLMLTENMDRSYQEMRTKFAELRTSEDQKIENFLDESDPNKRRELNKPIMAVFNQYEFIAIAIKQGVLDEQIYKKMQRGLLLRDYEYISAWLVTLRNKEQNPKIGENLEELALKWKSESFQQSSSD